MPSGWPVLSMKRVPVLPASITGRWPALTISRSPAMVDLPKTSVAYCVGRALWRKSRLARVISSAGAQAHRNERAKYGAKVRRQHRRSHAFAGDIGHDEIQIAIVAGDEIAVVAADDAGRLIVVGDVPAGEGDVARWEQAFLDLRGQLKVVLERALLLGSEAIQTDAGQGILA